jgi:hypothetical protein
MCWEWVLICIDVSFVLLNTYVCVCVCVCVCVYIYIHTHTHTHGASVNRAILQQFSLVRQHWGGCRYHHFAANFKAF